MEILNLQDLPRDLLEVFLATENGEKSVFSQLASSQTGNDRVVTTARIRYIIDSPDHLMYVVVDEKELLGMVLAQRVTGINNSYMYIHDIVVNPEARSHGVGTLLMNTIMEKGRAKWPEIVRMQLTSRPSRGTGPFFEKFGFRARTEESGDPTIVYVQDIGNYTS